ncbi:MULTISPECIES: DUF983 domain-containing protein [unclassified Chelatococcus]|uniref:DUF983 domain-containing protein n=1 Tax=unclassified Chelatococcus TaxID=2638111 RepID=UPI001BCD7C79|nr:MULTISPECIES: DUF983 domain-containing protein [unclassified Chelatococcus]MBS7699266.1 DUF983 domain-containing protein [Chelatococcus sp. YT9]MBX3557602.1 DUF983 domain-containing protein [Chelatococcus sp.]
MASHGGLTLDDDSLPRPWWPAISNGLRCRCPACGEGRIFSGFLKVVPVCARCDEDLSAQRSDDLPPYIVITIVGHIIGGGILAAEAISELPLWMHAVAWPLLTVVLCLVMMQPIKGAVVAHQWALRMHGFNKQDQSDTIGGAGEHRL